MKTTIVCSLLLIFCTTAIGGFKNPVSIISPIDQYVYAGERIDYSGLDSYDPDGGSITQYTWYIDDQQAGTGSGFSQTYILDKTETHRVISIKLKVKDNEGAIDYYSYQIAIKRKPEYHFYVKDHLGNIRVTVDEQGEIVSKDDYYPFGLRMPGRSHTSGAGNDIYKFSGKELDDENGLGLYWFNPGRYYDPALGRFTTSDPHSDSYLSLTPYNYVGNNPLRFIDPTGMDSTDTQDKNSDEDENKGDEPEEAAEAAAVAVGISAAAIDGPLPLGDLILGGILGYHLYKKVKDSDSNNENENDKEEEDSDSAQDKKLSKGEIKKLKDGGVDVHDLKGGKSASKYDLYKDPKGNIKIKPKSATGPGEPTGLNINNF